MGKGFFKRVETANAHDSIDLAAFEQPGYDSGTFGNEHNVAQIFGDRLQLAYVAAAALFAEQAKLVEFGGSVRYVAQA